MPLLASSWPLTIWLRAEVPRAPWRGIVLRGCAAGAIVFALLAIYQPFGTYEARIEHKLWWLSGYGWITALVFVLCGASARVVPLARYQRWHLAIEILVTLQLAIAASYVFNAWAQGLPLSLRAAWHFAQLGLAIGIVPVAFLLLLSRERVDLAIAPRVADAVNSRPESTRLTLLGENKAEQLTLEWRDLLYVKAADNYSEIVFLANAGIRRHLLRGSLSAVERQLAATPIVRVHRSFLVNPDRVAQWRGNAQGGQLSLAGSDERVPVARAYVARVRTLQPG